MESRNKILWAIAQNQPASTPLPDISDLAVVDYEVVEKFSATLAGIGGQVVDIVSVREVVPFVKNYYEGAQRIITTVEALGDMAETDWQKADPHSLENVDLMIMEAEFGVAENGALWVTEAYMGQRVAPFITQNLAVILKRSEIVPTMHHAYGRIGTADYPFGMFLAGPSKTADIEQSLVLGAHGSRTMTVFLMVNE
ncbi:MAG: LUD domain-containing protein [Bacteroidetes bacterium]|nr:LUD domain-containing protein [Bacteroidota bacterium]